MGHILRAILQCRVSLILINYLTLDLSTEH